MSFPEVGKMVKLIYGDETPKYHTMMSALTSKIKDLYKDISESEFVELAHGLPALLFPIFEHLRIVKKNTLGINRWDEIRVKVLLIARRRMHSNKESEGAENFAEISRILEKVNQNQDNRKHINNNYNSNYSNKNENARPNSRKNVSPEQLINSTNENEGSWSPVRDGKVRSPTPSQGGDLSPSHARLRRLSNASSNASDTLNANARRLSNASIISIGKHSRRLSNASDVSIEKHAREVSRGSDSFTRNSDSSYRNPRRLSNASSESLKRRTRGLSIKSDVPLERTRRYSTASDLSLGNEFVDTHIPRSKPKKSRPRSSSSSKEKIVPLVIDSDVAEMAKLSKVREMLNN